MQNAIAEKQPGANPNPTFAGRDVLVLGIESSCDETAAAVLRRHKDGRLEVLSSIISSQDEKHAPYGGVVPEIAARAHMEKIDHLVKKAVAQADIAYSDLDGIAATAGPGLIGGVITGLMCAKGLALALDVPLVPVNHLEGHALSPRLSGPCDFPFLLLLVSGGHTQLLSVNGLGDYERLGSTVDDAAGEAFDKTAKIMSLGFPGGPALERMALFGDEQAVDLPKPFMGKPHADFSFAGLKTAAARAFAAQSNVCEQGKADLAASFQRTVTDIICDRTQNAMRMFGETHSGAKRFVAAGGVAANTAIREGLAALCAENEYEMIVPPLKFCTDNAAMIALAGAEHLAAGRVNPDAGLAVKARPRWPLDAQSAAKNPASGSGRKGAKS